MTYSLREQIDNPHFRFYAGLSTFTAMGFSTVLITGVRFGLPITLVSCIFAIGLSAMVFVLLSTAPSLIRSARPLKNIRWLVDFPEITALVMTRNHLRVSKFGIAEGELNAELTPGGDIVMGSKILEKFTEAEVGAISVHELGHASRRIRKSYLVALFVGLVLWLPAWWSLPAILVLPGFVGQLVMWFWLAKWISEYDVDDFACKEFSPTTTVSALERLKLESGRDWPTLSHPSLSSRISRIKRRHGGRISRPA